MKFSQPGLLLIDKPEGMTSHDVVARARRLLQTKAVGHCGTLDPMATGLLILLLGDATKLSDHLLTQSKEYETRVKLGVVTDSLDMTGEIQKECDPVELERLTLETVQEQVRSIQGEIELEIPIYSAKKVNGKKLYELAREGKKVDAPKKVMTFNKVEFLGYSDGNADVRLECQKGGFIRAWGKELGERLKVGGTLSQLRRVASYPWKVDKAITLAELEEKLQASDQALGLKETLADAFIPMGEALPHMASVCVDSQEERLLSNGQIPHSLSARLMNQRREAVQSRETIGIQVFDRKRENMLALLQATPEQGLKIRKVFRS